MAEGALFYYNKTFIYQSGKVQGFNMPMIDQFCMKEIIEASRFIHSLEKVREQIDSLQGHKGASNQFIAFV